MKRVYNEDGKGVSEDARWLVRIEWIDADWVGRASAKESRSLAHRERTRRARRKVPDLFDEAPDIFPALSAFQVQSSSHRDRFPPTPIHRR